jgi:hypothetical protein
MDVARTDLVSRYAQNVSANHRKLFVTTTMSVLSRSCRKVFRPHHYCPLRPPPSFRPERSRVEKSPYPLHSPVEAGDSSTTLGMTDHVIFDRSPLSPPARGRRFLCRPSSVPL